MSTVRFLAIGAAATVAVAWVHAAVAPSISRTVRDKERWAGQQLALETPLALTAPRVQRLALIGKAGDGGRAARGTGEDSYGWPLESLSSLYRRNAESSLPTYELSAGIPLGGYRQTGPARVRRALPVVPTAGFGLSTIFYGSVITVAIGSVSSRVRARRAAVVICRTCGFQQSHAGVCEFCGAGGEDGAVAPESHAKRAG